MSNNSLFFQPKLTINQPGDIYEREADAVAEKVMRMPDTKTAPLFFQPQPLPVPPVQRKCGACENDEKLQMKEEEEEQAIQLKPLKEFDIQRKCAACEEEEKISRKESATTASHVVTPSVHSTLNSPGQSLDKSTRSFMESRFGYDFSHVRIHNDVLAHTSSKEINALAYTHGDHVVFGAGQYQPHTKAGRQLLAHELTHVVQQGKIKSQDDIQRKPGELTSYNIPVGSAPLEKYSVEIENKYWRLYQRTNDPHYSKIASFIRKCRTEGICNKILTMKEVDQLYGIAKENGFESSTAAVIRKIPVPLQLKLVRFFVAEIIEFAEFQKIFLDEGYVILDDPLAVCIEGCHHLSDMPKFPVIPDCNEPSPEELKRGSEEEYELKGATEFSPTGDLATYINYNLKTKNIVTIKVRFGDLSHGVITLTKKFFGNLNDPFMPFNPGNRFGTIQDIGCISFFDDDYEKCSGSNILRLDHQGLNTSSQNRSLALAVRIDQGVITGMIGWLHGYVTDFSTPQRNQFDFNHNQEDFVPVVFGEDHAGEKFEGEFSNKLENGALKLMMQGGLSVINQQKIYATFAVNDEAHSWSGGITSDIAGTDPYYLTLERTPEGYMSGDSYELQLNGEWKGKGYEASGQIHIRYTKGKLSALGHGKIAEPGKNPRYSGEITISLTDYPTAEKLFFKHIPPAAGAIVPPPQYENVVDTNLPAPDQKLALAAWGKFNFKVTEGTDTLRGDTAFVVHPTGAIVTAGQIKLNTAYKIFSGIPKNVIEIIKPRWRTFAEFDFPPVEVDISAKAGLDAWYQVGDVMFKELTLSGVYSNFKGYYSEYKIEGVFDVDANVGAELKAAIKIALNADFLIAEWELASVEFTIIGTGNLDVHVRAKPSISLVDSGPGKMPTYTLGGKLDLNGELTLGLKAGASARITLFKIDKDEEEKETKEKTNEANLGSAQWTIGNFGFSKEIAHTIKGTEKLPDLLPPTKPEIWGLASAIWKKYWKSGPKTKAGFEEGGKKKGEASETAFEPIEKAGESIGKYSVDDSFKMNGASHNLYMIVSGTKANPDVEIFMHSDDHDKLLHKVDEEIAEEKVATGQLMLDQKATQINKEELTELNEIKDETNKLIQTTKAIATNGDAADRGVEHLADKIEDYGNKFEKTDLKDDTKHPVPLSPSPAIGGPASTLPDIKVDDVVVDKHTLIGYIVRAIKMTVEIDGRKVTGVQVEIEGGKRFFLYETYDLHWYKPKMTEVQPFTVTKRDPRANRITHIRVGQENWEKGTKAGKIHEKESAAIDYDPKGPKWNQAGHLVAHSLGGPGSYRSANIVPMTEKANHSYTEGMRKIENAVWQDINATYAIYDYSVEPIYDATIQRPPVKVIVKVDKKFPPDAKMPSYISPQTEIDNKV